ncbi:MAG TPA: carbohydrate-binding family 9-like protein [Clostridia bacterium]|nr:carbohydrate-binding family 9-like protein [Clostridia bacterium]
MKSYNTFIFDAIPLWDEVPVAKLSSFHWESENPYRPDSYAKLCAVKNVGFVARLWSYESSPRAVLINRDEPIYQDSCLELFLKPVVNSSEYINIECNSNGVFLSQFGDKRNDRLFIKDVTDISPSVKPWVPENGSQDAWGVEIIVPNELVSILYKVKYKLFPCEIKGNFYKCGDLTETPHYSAFFPVDTIELGFHNPERFGSIKLK